jgi:hypothetical protein
VLDEARIGIVVRPLDRALVVLRFGLIPFVALCVSLPVISSTLEGSPGEGNQLMGLAGPLVAVTYLVLLQVQAVGGRIDRVLALVRRRIALACDHDYASTHQEGGIACRLTPEIFHSPLFRYEKQADVVKDLARACGDEDGGGFWFVEGQGGTGKTRTALRLVQALIRDNRLFEYGCRCYLYDLSRSPSVQTELVKKLRRGRFEKAVVLVDNFHLVSPTQLQDLTDLLVDRGESQPARLLVFFARPGDSWSLGPGADVRLLSEAKSAGCHATLGGPRAQVVEERISRIDEQAADLISALRANGTASAAQLHLAQVIARNGTAPPDVLATLHLLLETPGDSEPSLDLVTLLGVLAAVAVHRGSFSRADLRKAIRLAAPERGDGKPFEALRLHASFRRLRRLGLVTKVDLDGPHYVFHEELAELCVDRLARSAAFESSLSVVGEALLEERRERGEPLEAWMIAAEIGAQQAMTECFEAALAKGAMRRMEPCLSRAQDRYTLAPSSNLQLAILLDRTGKFAKSRAVFADEPLAGLAPSEDLALLLAASRVEANHPTGHEADLRVLLSHPEPLVRLVGRYWELHVDTHRGRFAPDAILDLAAEAMPMVKERSRFWQKHSLGRMHFDSLRCFYLAGRQDFREVESATRHSIDSYLKKILPNFEGMRLLYRHAHLIGHVLLPRLALLDQDVDAGTAAFAGLELGRPATVEDLAEGTLYYYRRAQDEFWQVGDREESYLKADVLNARMMQVDADLPKLKGALDDYRNFISGGDFSSLNGYPYFYYFRWHLLQHYAQLAQHAEAGGEHPVEARRALDRMIACDSESGNRYGLRRGSLMKLLLEGTDEGFERFEVTALEAMRLEMEQCGYRFERDLLARLIRQEGRVSHGELAAIFRYYPFVHQ